ncbi:DNA topoisomerase 1 alpha [Linum grandiflorum]
MVMAVQTPARRVMVDMDDDDDDKPLVFRRHGSSAARQTQVKAEVKRLPSSSQNVNGQSSNGQRDKAPVASSKSPPVKSPIGSPRPSSSSMKASPLRSPVSNPKSSISLENKQRNASSAVKMENKSIKSENKSQIDDEDSEDDKPLSYRMKGSGNNAQKGVGAPSHVKKEDSDDDDDDDDLPLASRISTKPTQSSEKNPLSSRSQPNGSTSYEKKVKNTIVPNKRPMEKSNTMDQSSAKKPKLSAPSSTTAQVKPPASKAEDRADDDDDVPISQRIKKPAIAERKQSSSSKALKVVSSSFKKANINSKKLVKTSKYSTSKEVKPSSTDGQKKWTTLVHNGVIFPPPYQPHGVKIRYKGKPVDLTPQQEEVATMFAVMKDTEYMQKPKFLENFWNDWRKILGKNHVIQKLDDCDFTPIYNWHEQEKEKKKNMSTEEKKAIKEEKLKQEEKYMWAIVDGVKEKVGNFRVEPPGLFRGRGDHPKMGKLKRRIRPKDITINIGKDAPIPECPVEGESWNEIKHDNRVTWLAFWNDPINPKEFKYVFLAASSSLKGQSDKEKYEKARKLKVEIIVFSCFSVEFFLEGNESNYMLLQDYIRSIRTAYTRDFTSKDVTKRQIAVATYLIDKLALRAGNEKDDDEADTVGCCTLKVSNVECVPPNMIKFDFLGKDSIRYENTVEVELPVFKAIGQFQTSKKDIEPLFDQLDTSKLNAHLKELMPGLTAKVFRTYNASITLDEQLYEETEDGDVAEKMVVYQKANKQVAIICNHQRTVSKSHDSQMMKLTERIDKAKQEMKELKTDLERAKKGKPPLKGADGKPKKDLTPEAIEKKIASEMRKIEKHEMDMKTKEDLKTVALGTSKINYLDPRITVAWCKRHEVPIEKIFNKSLLAKFAWAMDVDPQFRF